MKERTTLVSFKASLIEAIKRQIKRRRIEFCKLHNISEGNLSKILNHKVNPSDEIIDYLCQFCDIDVFAEWHKVGHFQY